MKRFSFTLLGLALASVVAVAAPAPATKPDTTKSAPKAEATPAGGLKAWAKPGPVLDVGCSTGKAFANLDNSEVLNLRFPLHISRVKNEYNSSAKEKDKKVASSDDDPLLSFSIGDEQGGVEGDLAGDEVELTQERGGLGRRCDR